MVIALMFVGLCLIVFAISSSITGFIPKKGRCMNTTGEEITATIINNNDMAEKPTTLRAVDENGVKYSVKLRPTESKKWIKGDKIKIAFSADKKEYRIYFHEYFKENEARMRDMAFAQLEKTVGPMSIASKATNITKESLEALRASEADSQTVFILATYMTITNRYSVFAIIMAVLCVFWCSFAKLQMFKLLVPIIIMIVLFLSISSTAKVCTKIYDKFTKKS